MLGDLQAPGGKETEEAAAIAWRTEGEENATFPKPTVTQSKATLPSYTDLKGDMGQEVLKTL